MNISSSVNIMKTFQSFPSIQIKQMRKYLKNVKGFYFTIGNLCFLRFIDVVVLG